MTGGFTGAGGAWTGAGTDGVGAGAGAGDGVGAGVVTVGVADVATLIRSLASSYAADLPISLHRPRRHVQLMKSCELLIV